MAPDPRSFTLTEAAAATGLSRVTLRRWLDASRFPNAFRRPPVGRAPATWLIPASDLTASGLNLDGTSVPRRQVNTEPDRPTEVELRLVAAEATAAERLRTIELLERQVAELQETIRTHLADRDGEG